MTDFDKRKIPGIEPDAQGDGMVERTIRVTDKLYDTLMVAINDSKEADARMQLVMNCVLATENIDPPAPLVREGKDAGGKYLVVRVPG